MLLKIAHVDDAHDPRYVVVREPASYVIGFAGESDIVLLDSTVEKSHARLTLQEGRIFVENLSDAGTFVDERPVHGSTEVTRGQWIQLGETVLQVLLGDQPPRRNHDERRPPSAAEDGFLATLRLDPTDDETRGVYADWLEAAECPITAGYIRLELANKADIATSELVERATTITQPEWRLLIRRGPIGHCDRVKCPATWHALAPTREPFTRDCTTCEQPVHYCPDREVIARYGQLRARVVFDASVDISAGTDAYFYGLYPDRNIARTHRSLFPLRPEEHEITYDRAFDTDVDDDEVF